MRCRESPRHFLGEGLGLRLGTVAVCRTALEAIRPRCRFPRRDPTLKLQTSHAKRDAGIPPSRSKEEEGPSSFVLSDNCRPMLIAVRFKHQVSSVLRVRLKDRSSVVCEVACPPQVSLAVLHIDVASVVEASSGSYWHLWQRFPDRWWFDAHQRVKRWRHIDQGRELLANTCKGVLHRHPRSSN